jgi:hypothetical protein
MKLEITPEPSDAERAAITAAFTQEMEIQRQVRDECDGDDCEETVKP